MTGRSHLMTGRSQKPETCSLQPSRWTTALICAGILGATIVILLLMGRPLICTCGTIKLWHGEVVSAENSQHISDWYTFSHVTHGFLFYWIAWVLSRWIEPLRSVRVRLILAVLAESGWEILENTDFIIERYREATIALDYFGDSVLNSSFDVVFMALGFLAASRLPALASLSIAVAFEVFMAIMIRDNLALNILMLVWPIEAVKTWQGGA
jgi:hypothetical protein